MNLRITKGVKIARCGLYQVHCSYGLVALGDGLILSTQFNYRAFGHDECYAMS